MTYTKIVRPPHECCLPRPALEDLRYGTWWTCDECDSHWSLIPSMSLDVPPHGPTVRDWVRFPPLERPDWVKGRVEGATAPRYAALGLFVAAGVAVLAMIVVRFL